jgi:hypothetical protein
MAFGLPDQADAIVTVFDDCGALIEGSAIRFFILVILDIQVRANWE